MEIHSTQWRSCSHCQHYLIFADIESENWLCICPRTIEEKITDRTKSIVVMHYAGFACDMPEIMRIAKEHGLSVIEDRS
ncbi:MAG: DegT/DnrJ/EryC1/StrS family aminotransferase, partial [Anaerolineaceae bacterium]|nr:DegT/DnrJ/EryC1/StrS family aminotransferase [Anaerolineaceae bacterium]